jgi:hypothetical protein
MVFGGGSRNQLPGGDGLEGLSFDTSGGQAARALRFGVEARFAMY